MQAAAGVLIVSACAFDSVPADLGVLFAAKQFTAPAVCTSVESFLCVQSDADVGVAGHTTTYELPPHYYVPVKHGAWCRQV